MSSVVTFGSLKAKHVTGQGPPSVYLTCSVMRRGELRSTQPGSCHQGVCHGLSAKFLRAWFAEPIHTVNYVGVVNPP